MTLHKPLIFTLLIAVALMACTKGKNYTCKVISTTFANADNSGAIPVAPTADSVSAAAYAISAQSTAVIISGDNGFDDKYETQYMVINSINKVNIYSLTDFDATHPALASLNDCFNLLSTSPDYKTSALSSGYSNPDFGFKNKKSDADTFRASNYFTLMQRPAILGNRTFVVTATRVDSTMITDTLHIRLY